MKVEDGPAAVIGMISLTVPLVSTSFTGKVESISKPRVRRPAWVVKDERRRGLSAFD